MSTSSSKSNRPRKLQLVVSEDHMPTVRLQPGMHFDVYTVELVNAEELLEPVKAGARLCGGSNTCLALIDLESTISQPAPLER